MMRSTLGHAHSDQDSLTSTSQALLECLDRHSHHGRLNSAYEGIIRICLAEILANRRSEATMLNEGPCKYHNTDLQTTSGVKPQTPIALDEAMSLSSTDFSIPLLPSTLWQSQSQEYGHLSQESVGITSTPALGQLFPDFSSFSTSGSASYELGAQPFHSSEPQHGTRAEQIVYGPSTSRHQEPRAPIAQGSQKKVKCSWPGCSRFMTKDSFTRHVNETHLRKVKAVCARCEREFPRTYMKRNHELTCRGIRHKSGNS
ncbi:hypothetical protein AZE42_05808 [Rhizopogon vesiculosus]|uniref:C2H2-type domain-containing protein n=1 Tax=Rhizopogon vesiculosus TaxID=180088 RepID=A0A1J8QY68_9AGAM|nr:hypothetical protein AZE42_05808 [Rhizopogon vesiculosus]